MSFVAKGPEDLLSAAEVLGMTGLEFMRGILEGRLPGPPIGLTMGYTLHAVHGGWYGTLLDSAMACAIMTRVPKGSVYTTLEYKVNIIRPIPLGMEIECSGMTDHVGRSTGVAHGEIRGVEDGKIYATGSTTCIVMKL